jgi:hypothetical protein
VLHPWQFFHNHARSSRVFLGKQLDLLLLPVESAHVAIDPVRPYGSSPKTDSLPALQGDEVAHAVRYGVVQVFAALDEFLFCTLDAYGRALGYDVKGPVSDKDTLEALIFYLGTEQRAAFSMNIADLRMFVVLRDQFISHPYVNSSGQLPVSGPQDPMIAHWGAIDGLHLSPAMENWSGRRHGWVVSYRISSPKPLELLIGHCLLLYGVLLDHCLAQVPDEHGRTYWN